MKITVSSLGPGLDAEVDQHFGRAKWLVIYDPETGEIENIDNSVNNQAVQGAGIKTAELIVEKKCGTVIAGNLGPKALRALQQAGVKGYINASGTVKEAISAFQAGKLPEA